MSGKYGWLQEVGRYDRNCSRRKEWLVGAYTYVEEPDIVVQYYAVSAGFNKIAVEAQDIRKKQFSFREYYK